MAATRAKVPVGSAQWFLSERRQANKLVEQEVDEFTYSVRNEMEWMNEHMSEILSANHLNVADIFKTPGKLRGKTPRTARKRNALQERAPLTDIFAPNSQPTRSSPQKSQFMKQVEQFQIAQDADTRVSNSPSKKHVASGKENTDSGYHGTTEDEMDIDSVAHAPPPVPKHVELPQRQQGEGAPSPSREATEEQDSFVSAKEDMLASKNGANTNKRDDDEATIPDDDLQRPAQEQSPQKALEEAVKSPERAVVAETTGAAETNITVAEDPRDPMEIDDLKSPSQGSSPVQPLLRKSSLTFASLPAREPLGSKQSIGNRVSRTSHLDQYKAAAPGRNSHLSRTTGGKSLGATQANMNPTMVDDNDENDSDIENTRPKLSRIESETTMLHNKTSTQRLHDRINMLGQTKEPRTSKSTQNMNAAAQPVYPNLTSSLIEKNRRTDGPAVPMKDHIPTARAVEPDTDDDDDWIAPVHQKAQAARQSKSRPMTFADAVEVHQREIDQADFVLRVPVHRSPDRAASPLKTGAHGHVKSISASAMPSPTKAAMAAEASRKKAISVSNPDMPHPETTTPAGSPNRKHVDGPLSASKAKLYSVFKSAKGIFASSAAVSAQAKSEVLSPKRSREQFLPMTEELLSPNPEVHPIPALYPIISDQLEEPAKPSSPSRNEGRRTRSSTERDKEEKRKEKDAKEKQRMVGELDKAREKEKQKAAAQKVQRTKAAEAEAESADEMPPPPPPKSLLPMTAQPQTKGQPRRPMKPSKENLNKSTGPPKPITVHLTSQAGRMMGQNQQPSNAALSASLQDSLPPQPPPKQQQQGVGTKASNSSLYSQPSGSTSRTNVLNQSGRPKALEVAAKKKEQEEKAAQRKAEQKREMEQRRAAKLEEERKAKEEEQRRTQETKRAAQRKADEAKRLEQQKKEAARPPSRQANDLANALQQERLQGAPVYQRADLGTVRPVSQMKTVPELPPRPNLPVNHAKPAKRPFQQEQDDEPMQRPTMQRNPPSYQQLDAKRRRTNEAEEDGENRRSVMAPPIRNSNIRKEPNKFPHGYVAAPQQTSHTNSIFKTAVTTQHQLQQQQQPPVKLPTGHPHDMAKYANARIPFADAPNPPAGSSAITTNSQTYKTPLRPEGATIASKSAAKSSPHYPPGESIQLPEIATDSEDEDSDNEFAAPSWVASPFLNQALSSQHLVDPESIFGPIGELKMDEIFKNKERAKRWRERTSSANWSGTDRLTEEERRRDRAGRERLMKDGGWTYATVPES